MIWFKRVRAVDLTWLRCLSLSACLFAPAVVHATNEALVQLSLGESRNIAVPPNGMIQLDLNLENTGVLVVESSGGDAEILYGDYKIDGAEQDPSIEWVEVFAESRLATVRLTQQEPGAVVNLQLRKTDAESRKFFDASFESALPSRDDRRERSRAIELSLRALDSLPSEKFYDLYSAFVLRTSLLYRTNSDQESAQMLLADYSSFSNRYSTPDRYDFEMATLHYELGDLAQARKSYCAILLRQGKSVECVLGEVSKNGARSLFLSKVLNRLGLISHREGELSAADSWYRLAAKSSPNTAIKHRALIRMNRGGVQFLRGNFVEALQKFENSLRAFLDLGDEHNASVVKRHMAESLIRLGSYDKAIRLLVDAVEYARSEANRGFEANLLARLAELYFDLGDYAEAKSNSEAALALENVGSGSGVARALMIKANLNRELGDPALALDLHRQLEELQAKAKLLPSELLAKIEVIRDLQALGRYEDAIDKLEEGLAVAKSTGAGRSSAHLYGLLAKAERITGNLTRAREALEIALAESSLPSIDKAGLLEEQAKLHFEMGADSKAIASIGLARESARNAFETLLVPRLRAYANSKIYQLSKLEIEILTRSNRSEDALLVALAERNRGFSEEHNSRRIAVSRQSIEDERKMLKAKLAWKYEQGGYSENGNSRAEISELLLQLDQFGLPLAVADRTTTAQIENIDQLQRLIPFDTLLLVFENSANKTIRWTIGHSYFQSALLSRPEIPRKLEELGNGFVLADDGNGELLSIAERILSDIPVVGIQTLWLMPDELLSKLPFAMLPIPGSDSMTVVDRFNTLILADTNRLGLDRVTDDLGRSAFVVADPSYSAIHTDQPGNTGVELARLSHSAIEADAVANIMESKGAEVELLLGEFASKDRFVERISQRWEVVHIAAHAIARPDRPQLGGIAFSNSNSNSRSRSSFLTNGEISDLMIRSDLVVLSACSSGSGTAVVGEFPLGLARAFSVAGARQLVVSLWEVGDRATFELMRHFYSHWIDTRDAAAALRHAQRQMKGSRRWADPKHWAAFVAFGV